MDRLEAVLIVIGVEEGQLLLAVGGIGGLVDIQGDGLGHPGKGATEKIDHGEPHARQITPGGQVLQARQGGLAHQIAATFRQPPAGQLEGRVVTQAIQIVAVLVAAGNGKEPGADHLVVAVKNPRRIARVRQARSQGRSDPKPRLDLAQHQNPAVRGETPAIETGHKTLAMNG